MGMTHLALTVTDPGNWIAGDVTEAAAEFWEQVGDNIASDEETKSLSRQGYVKAGEVLTGIKNWFNGYATAEGMEIVPKCKKVQSEAMDVITYLSQQDNIFQFTAIPHEVKLAATEFENDFKAIHNLQFKSLFVWKESLEAQRDREVVEYLTAIKNKVFELDVQNKDLEEKNTKLEKRLEGIEAVLTNDVLSKLVHHVKAISNPLPDSNDRRRLMRRIRDNEDGTCNRLRA